MPKKKTTKKKTRDVAIGLVRCSTDHQDHSIADQAAEIQSWAIDTGHELLEVFEDEALTGSKLDRPGVLRMLAYLERSKLKGTLVAWKRNRLARPDDPREGLALELKIEQLGWKIHYLHGSKQSGNQLIDTLMGVIEHHEAGQFLKNLASDSLRGQAKRAKDGTLGGFRTPYGFAKELTSPTGRVRVVPRGEPHLKLREEKARLVAGDPEEVKIVRWIFKRAATGEASATGMACLLNDRGVPSATGGKWSFRSVQGILANPACKGDFHWNVSSAARYYRFKDGQPTPAPKPRQHSRNPELMTHYRRNDPKDWVVREGHHEALVSPELFKLAGDAMSARSSRPATYQRMKPTVYPLSGLLFCGNCGMPMTGRKTNAGKKNPKWVKFNYTCQGGSERKGCKLFSLRVDRFEPVILRLIRETLLPAERGPELRALIEARVAERLGAEDPLAPKVSSIRSKISDLETRINQAVENLGRMRGKAADLLAAQVEAWANDLDELRVALVEAETNEGNSRPSAESLVEDAMDLVKQIETVGTESSPRIRRALYHRVIRHLEVSFETTMVGRKKRHLPTGGRLTLVDSPSMSVMVQPPQPGRRRRPTGRSRPRIRGPRPG